MPGYTKEGKKILNDIKEKIKLYWCDLRGMVVEWWEQIHEPEDPEAQELIDLLSDIEVFSGLRSSQYLALADYLHERQFTKGESIFSEGDPATAMYIICNGRVELSCPAVKQMDGSYLESGNIFGELALCCEHRRMYDARTRASTKTLVLFRKGLERFVYRNPSAGLKVHGNLTAHIGQQFLKIRQENLRLNQQDSEAEVNE